MLPSGSPEMERDFLGLLTVKEENVVKEEKIDITVDSARGRETGMQWSFSNSSSSGPSQYLSFNAPQEVRPTMDSNQKLGVNGAQKVMVIDKSAVTHYPVSAYPLHHISTHSVNRSHEMRKFASANQPNQDITVTMSPAIVHPRISPGRVGPQPFGGVPVLPPVSVLPSTGSVIGSTDLRNGSKQNPGASAQLTIFYAGSVNVFDDVSPEKAEAIMLLARNVAPVVHHKNVPATEASGPFKKPITDEGLSLNRTRSPAFLSLPGALSVSSQVGSPSQGKPTCNLELATVKSSVTLKPTAVTQQEPPKVIHSLGSPAAPLFSTVALPQARKASLAWFLEKRKARVMGTSPYPVSKISPESSMSKALDD